MSNTKSYNLIHHLGSGEFSEVYKCVNADDIHAAAAAIKIIDKAKIANKFRLIKRELEILAKLKHNCRNRFDHHLENVLQLEDYFMTDNHICIITELCLEIDLYDLIVEKKQVVETDRYVFVLLDALKFIHSNGIIHRDIKAENVLLRDMSHVTNENVDPESGRVITWESLVIADFGLATRTSDKDSLTEFVGTVSYIAPEVLACDPKKLVPNSKPSPYDCKVDVWSLGVLAYFIAFGYMPFDCETDEETIECIQEASYYLDLGDFTIEETPDSVRHSFKDFLDCCFQANPEKRFSVAQLKSHPFIAKCESLYEMQPLDLKINKSSASLSSFLFSAPSEQTPELVSSIPMVQQVSLNTEQLSSLAGSRQSSATSIKSPSTGLYRSRSAELMNTIRSRENLRNIISESKTNSFLDLPMKHRLYQQKNNPKNGPVLMTSESEKVEFYL